MLIPGTGYRLPLGPFWYVFIFLVIAGASNGVNLTDGLDGLAAGTAIISLFTFTTMAVIAYIRSNANRPVLREPNKLDLAIVGAALIGAAVGFLWYNAFPAEVFMGDTGSMALGGALAGFAIMMKAEVLLLFIGGVYLIEALSVIIQVFTFKYLGRRVPDGADPPPLRDEGVVGDEDHGPLLDPRRASSARSGSGSSTATT